METIKEPSSGKFLNPEQQKAYRKTLIEGNIPAKKEVDTYDLAGELRREVEAEDDMELSPEEIRAVAAELRTRFDIIQGAASNILKAGGDENLRNKLVEELASLKKMNLEESGVTEETYGELPGDSDKIKKEKGILKAAVDHIMNIGL